jgi:hypothetical protein
MSAMKWLCLSVVAVAMFACGNVCEQRAEEGYKEELAKCKATDEACKQAALKYKAGFLEQCKKK